MLSVGHEHGAVLQHQLDRVVAQVVAVLDAGGSAQNSDPHSGVGQGVRGDRPPAALGREPGHETHVLHGQARIRRVVCGRADAAGGRDLDGVGAHAHELAHGADDVVVGVDDARRGHARAHGPRRQRSVGTHRVGVASGGRQHRDGQVQPGPDGGAARDGVTVARGEAVEVARGGHAGEQGGSQHRRGLEHVLLREPRALRLGVARNHAEVHVRVDEPRHEEGAREVDRALARHGRSARSDVGDHPVDELDLGIRQRRTSGAVDERRAHEAHDANRQRRLGETGRHQPARLNPGAPGSASSSRRVYQCCGSE